MVQGVQVVSGAVEVKSCVGVPARGCHGEERRQATARTGATGDLEAQDAPWGLTEVMDRWSAEKQKGRVLKGYSSDAEQISSLRERSTAFFCSFCPHLKKPLTGGCGDPRKADTPHNV